jgi:hypothetical protein
VLSVPNQVFAAEFVLSAVNQVFAAEFMLSAANQVFAAELCCPQRSSIRCQKCIGCSELAFAAEVVLSAAEA